MTRLFPGSPPASSRKGADSRLDSRQVPGRVNFHPRGWKLTTFCPACSRLFITFSLRRLLTPFRMRKGAAFGSRPLVPFLTVFSVCRWFRPAARGFRTGVAERPTLLAKKRSGIPRLCGQGVRRIASTPPHQLVTSHRTSPQSPVTAPARSHQSLMSMSLQLFQFEGPKSPRRASARTCR